MDSRGGDDYVKKAYDSRGRLLSERLNKERTKAIDVLHGKKDKNTKENPEKPIKAVISSRNVSKASSVITTVSQGKKSPINKENVCHNSKKTQSVFLEPKPPTASKTIPKNGDLTKSPTRRKENEENFDTNTSTNPISLRTLQNSSTRSIFEANSRTSSARFDNQSKSNFSDYVPYRLRDTIDISDLITNDSITLEYRPLPVLGVADVSFHPAEMTGRSTLHKRDSKLRSSVDEILASSRFEEVRNSVIGCGSSVGNYDRLSAASSCISGFSAMQKNPRPTTVIEEEISKFNDLGSEMLKAFDSNVSSEVFAPAAQMHAKMLQDEISWAKECAAVPTTVLTDEALRKLNIIHQSSAQNSMQFNDTNVSAGRYFAMRSDNVIDMIQKESPERQRDPIALVGDETVATTTSSPEKSLDSLADPITPVVRDKCFSNVTQEDTITLTTNRQIPSHDSKDSGNASGKSDFLSLSTIDRALGKLEGTGSDSGLMVIKELFLNARNNNNNNEGITNPYELSPLSSPCSYLSSSANSPSNNGESVVNRSGTSIGSHDSKDSGNASGKSDFLSLSTIDRALGKLEGTGSDSGLMVIKELFLNARNNNNNNEGITNPYELSPLSSPCSYLSSSANSPSNNGESVVNRSGTSIGGSTKSCRCSPQLDSTTNSELRYLNAVPNGYLRRVASSPSRSESCIKATNNKSNSLSTIHCGVPPTRTYSSNSVKCSDSTSTRSASRCSNNSEFSHRDGKGMPLKATALELSWASVKLRTDSQKSMQVKNTSSKRLVVRVEISGPGFQLINPDTNMLTLHSQECRTIVVNFYPTMTGPAIGKLVFQPPRSLNSSGNSNSDANACVSSEVIIPLYAYGGNASITIQHLLRGPVGAPFLPMGEFCTLVRPLERSFQIYNKGPLMGFAAIYIEPIDLHVPEISSAFIVHPECTLIEPSTAVTIRIIFQPNHSDLKKIRKIIHDVLTLAKLRIIYGDEAIRQRLRQIQRVMSLATRDNVFTRSLDKLWTRFPGEQVMFPSGLFKDSSSVAQDMWACISEQQVALTLNNNMLDETAAELSTIFTEADNTVLFRTVCVPSPTANQLETVDELLEETHVMNTTRPIEMESASDKESIGSMSALDSDTTATVTISPEIVEIHQNSRKELEVKPSALRVRNFSSIQQYFEVVCNQRDLLHFVPGKGCIQPNDTEFSIEIRAHPDAKLQEIPHNTTIMVFLEKTKIVVPVHVPSNFSKKKR